jgi:hypothetical protein
VRRILLALLVAASLLATPGTAQAAWVQVYRQDFNAPLALGGWPGPYTDLTAYTGCCEAHNGVTWYDPAQTLSAHDGVLDIWVLKAWRDGAMRPIGSAIKPTIAGGILRGRITVRLGVFPDGADSMRLWSMSSLLFAKDNVWGHGEVNGGEGGLDAQIPVAFVHQLGAHPEINCSVQPAYGYRLAGWHTFVLDWYPWGFGFYIDGHQYGASSCALPVNPMVYVLQIGTLGRTPSADSHGRVLVDFIQIDRYQ